MSGLFSRFRSGGSQAQAETTSKPQDNALGLMHLRKLFTEFRHPNADATQRDQEDKLYKMLPIFCKVFYFVTMFCELCKVLCYDSL